MISARPRDLRHVFEGPSWRRWALWLLLGTGCSSGSGLHVLGNKDASGFGEVEGGGGLAGSGGDTGSGGVIGSGGAARTGGVTGTGGVVGTGGTGGRDGALDTGGNMGAGGLTGSGGVARTGGVAGSGGVVGTGGAGGVGGTSGSGRSGGSGGSTKTGSGGTTGMGGVTGTGAMVGTGGGIVGTGGATGSRGFFGMPCTTNQDCPSDAICCDGSSESCDGTRLPSGDGTNPGEFVVSADGLTTTDTITGLIWQRDGSGTPAGCTSSDNYCTWDIAQAYCASLVLGGVSGWRLPAWMELLTILDLTTGKYPTPDSTAFPDTGGFYWTSSVYRPMGTGGGELYVFFGGELGTVGLCPPQPYAGVQCVRGSRCYPKSRFVVLDGGLVRDTLTGLVWQQDGSSEAMTWADAQSYCSSLGFGSRLPTLKELDSLVDLTPPSGPTIDQAFADPGRVKYWTSSPYLGTYVDSSGDAYFGDFSGAGSINCEDGAQDWARVDASLRVRCVR